MGLDSPDTQKRLKKFRKAPMDGQSLKRLVEAGLTWLRTNHQTVNALNVFPVPDGDTGTNMVLTMQSAYNEIRELGHRSVGDMAAAVSQGALMGARGNSGVICHSCGAAFRVACRDRKCWTEQDWLGHLLKRVIQPIRALSARWRGRS